VGTFPKIIGETQEPGMPFRYLSFLILLLCAAIPARADTDPPKDSAPATLNDQVGDGSAAKIDLSKPALPSSGSESEESSSENENGEIEPLDSWYVPTPIPIATLKPESQKKEAEKPAELTSEDANSDDDEEDDDDPVELENVETDSTLPEQAANAAAMKSALRPRRIQTTKLQKRRLREARINRHRVMAEEAHVLGLDQVKVGDPRGSAELQICSLNLNNYGTVKDFTRIFKLSQLPRREKTELSALRAITARNCDVVALQGVLGQSDSNAEDAMSQFAKKLKKRTGGDWEFYLGSAGRGIVRNGFIYKNGLGEVVKQKSFGDVPLLNFAPFTQKEFGRAPVELILRVPRKNGAGSTRDIIFLSFHFQQGFVDKILEPETSRMQLADAVRQIIHSEQQSYSPDEPPIAVLLGDRSGPLEAPATQLLEGRMRLLDFTQNGGCELDASNKVQCKTPPTHLKEFFGMSTEGILVEPKVKKVKVDDVEKEKLVYPSKKKEAAAFKERREKTSEIYVLGPDVVFFQAEVNQRGRYISGIERVRTGLEKSPLVWATLNW